MKQGVYDGLSSDVEVMELSMQYTGDLDAKRPNRRPRVNMNEASGTFTPTHTINSDYSSVGSERYDSLDGIDVDSNADTLGDYSVKRPLRRRSKPLPEPTGEGKVNNGNRQKIKKKKRFNSY
jgi:hypothetical protein